MSLQKTATTSLLSLGLSIWQHRWLILQMGQREVLGRYKGSIGGLLWSFLNPILMLLVYTFVFSVVFKTRWGTNRDESQIEFALVLFVGMIVHGLFAEVLNRAPHLMVNHANYVKKVVFPLEILPVISAASAVFHSLASLFVMLVAFFLLNAFLPWTVVFIPIVLLPLLLFSLGLAWLFASLGVFVRDIAHGVSILTTVVLFMSPVFFPIAALPERFRPWMLLNPLTFIIEQARDVLIWGRMPDWQGLARYSLVALLVTWLGYAWFQKTRKGFADVL